jgi:tetratricopeptide (TPR) repeat protein
MRTSEYITFIKAASLIILINQVLFIRAIGFDFINFDDDTYLNYLSNISGLAFIDAISHIVQDGVNANWHPVTVLSLYVDWKLAGFNPGYYHFVNIIIHSFSAIVLYVILIKLSFGVNSLIIAILFSVHPVQLETVMWIAERKGLLSGLFSLVSIYFYLCSKEENTSKYLFLSWFMFVLAMLSKASLVILPIIYLLIDYYQLGWDSFRSNLFILVKKKWYYFLSAIVLTIVAIYMHQESGALSGIGSFTLEERIVNAFLAYKEYLVKLFYPVNLSVFYPYIKKSNYFGLILSVILVGLMLFISVKFRKEHKYLLLGCMWFILSLLPVIGLIKTGAHAYADRYLYFPSIGLFILIVLTVNKYSKLPRSGLLVVWMFVTVILVSVSSWQMQFWKDSFTLFERALEVTSNNYIAHRNLSSAYFSVKDFDKGMWHYHRSREIRHDERTLYEVATHQLLSAGRVDLADKVVSDMLISGYEDFNVFRTLGQIRINLKRYNEAVELLKQAESIQPEEYSVLHSIGVAYYHLGNNSKAIEYLEKAHNIKKNNSQTIELLISAHRKQNHPNKVMYFVDILQHIMSDK